MDPTVTYSTRYGSVTLYSNEMYIGEVFRQGGYWEEDALLALKPYIDPNRNVLEIGGHCGTSTLIYASFLNEGAKVYVLEPQQRMFDLLVKNIHDNHLTDKIIPIRTGAFCYTGSGHMNDVDVDGKGHLVSACYDNPHLPCNFGGISLGGQGEPIELTTVDDLKVPNVGFIHCDAQGAEPYIFSHAVLTLLQHRPVVYYENNRDNYLHEKVKQNYPAWIWQSNFDVASFCQATMNYHYLPRFHGLDDLLIPPKH